MKKILLSALFVFGFVAVSSAQSATTPQDSKETPAAPSAVQAPAPAATTAATENKGDGKKQCAGQSQCKKGAKACCKAKSGDQASAEGNAQGASNQGGTSAAPAEKKSCEGKGKSCCKNKAKS